MNPSMWTGAMNHRTENTVCTEMSGADSVLPSLAGWEETKPALQRRSSHHEAYVFGSRRPRFRRVLRRSVAQDRLVLKALCPMWERTGEPHE